MNNLTDAQIAAIVRKFADEICREETSEAKEDAAAKVLRDKTQFPAEHCRKLARLVLKAAQEA